MINHLSTKNKISASIGFQKIPFLAYILNFNSKMVMSRLRWTYNVYFVKIYSADGRVISSVFWRTKFFEMVFFSCKHHGCLQVRKFQVLKGSKLDLHFCYLTKGIGSLVYSGSYSKKPTTKTGDFALRKKWRKKITNNEDSKILSSSNTDTKNVTKKKKLE